MNTPTPDSYEAVIADLEAKRDQLTLMIENLKNMRSMASMVGVPGTAPAAQRGPLAEHEIGHDTFFGMTIADAARKYLGIVKRTKTTDEIVEAVESGGLKHASQDFNKTVRSVLGQQEGFVRVNGEWGLTEWYPGMRKDKKTKSVPVIGKPPAKKPNAKVGTDKPRAVHPRKGDISPGSIKAKLLEALAAAPRTTFNGAQLANAISSDIGSVRAALGELFARGIVLRPEQGQYQAKTADSNTSTATT